MERQMTSYNKHCFIWKRIFEVMLREIKKINKCEREKETIPISIIGNGLIDRGISGYFNKWKYVKGGKKIVAKISSSFIPVVIVQEDRL